MSFEKINLPIEKGYNGWTVKSYIIENGNNWEITTSKCSSGQIRCLANELDSLENKNGYYTSVWSMGNKSILCETSEKRATKNEICRVHNEGIRLFIEHLGY